MVRFLILLGVALGAVGAAAAHAAEVVYFASLSGAAQSPANSSSAMGTAAVVLDTSLAFLHVEVEFSGLEGTVTSAHLQGLTAAAGAGIADSVTSLPTLSGFVSGVSTGFYHGILDLNYEPTYNPEFVASQGGTVDQARMALESGLSAGQIYFNIRTSSFPDGEIRGFLAPSPTADFDHNGRVEAADLSLWTIAYGGANFGDADKDADTDGADLMEWQRQLGQVAEIPHHHHVTPAANAIPEARASTLALTAISLLALRRRRI